MAEGGEVSHFCSTSNKHNEDCEYFDGGGVVGKFSEAKDEGPPAGVDQAFSGSNDEGAPKQKSQKRLKFSEARDEGQPKFSEAKDEGAPSDDNAPEASAWDIAKDIGKTAFASSLVGQLTGHGHPDIHPQSKAAMEGFAGSYLPFGKQLISASGLDTKENIQDLERKYPNTELAGQAAGTVASYLAGPLKLAGAAIARVGGSQVMSGITRQLGQTTTDDISKYLLGTNPQSAGDAVAAWAMHAPIDIILGAGAGLASPVGAKLPEGVEKSVTKSALRFLEDLGGGPVSAKGLAATLGIGLGGGAVKEFFYGDKNRSMEERAKDAVITGGEGALAALLGRYVFKGAANFANRMAANAAAWALGNNAPEAVAPLARFAAHVYNGVKAAVPLVESAISGTAATMVPYATEKQKKYFHKSIEEGGTTQQLQNESYNAEPSKFAKGGDVQPVNKPDHLAQLYPEANVLISEKKGRIYNYMNSIRPTNFGGSKLPFDDHTPSKSKQKSYDKAMEYAINPLTIMNKVNKGDLTVEDMQHFTSLHPDVHQFLSKKMTEKIVEAQLKGEKPKYKNRQAMSLFLAAPLDSTFTPIAIQTIQGMYMLNKQAAQPAPQQKAKKSTSPLSKMAPSSLTDEQARTQREQNAKY